MIVAEIEPNGQAGGALALPLGVQAEGTIATEADEDFWRLDLPAPGEAERLALSLDLSAVAGLRPLLSVLDADGGLIAEQRARDVGRGVSFRNLAIGPDARLPFFVVVKSAWIGKRRSSAPDMPYRLVATARPAPADLEDEPNDVAEQATPIPGLGRIGYLAPAGDVDWYSITVDHPVVARVVVSGVEDVDLVLDAPDPLAGKDAVRTRANVGGVKAGELLPDLWLPAGTSYLRVASGSRRVDGKWVRDYENPDQTYTLAVTLRDAFPGDEIEPNGITGSATPLRIGQRARGFLYPHGDVDLYRLDIGVEDEGTLTAVVDALPRVETMLSLLGGQPVDGQVPVLRTAVADKQASRVRLVSEVEPGTYWLEVRDAKGTGANSADPYHLDVSVTFE